MSSPKQVTASEARQHIYQLLKQVSLGEEVIIRNTDTGDAYQIVKYDVRKLGPSKVELLEKLIESRPGLYPAHEPQEIKRIIAQRSDKDLS